MLRSENKPHNGGAKDGEIEMSLGMSRTVVGVERVVVRRFARSQLLAVADIAGVHVAGQRSPHGDDLAPRWVPLSEQCKISGSVLISIFLFLNSGHPQADIPLQKLSE